VASPIQSQKLHAILVSGERTGGWLTLRFFACCSPGRPRRDGGVGSQTTSNREQRPQGRFMSHLTCVRVCVCVCVCVCACVCVR
jgi:hypothetical protein